jgi:hypothetical protein
VPANLSDDFIIELIEKLMLKSPLPQVQVTWSWNISDTMFATLHHQKRKALRNSVASGIISGHHGVPG